MKELILNVWNSTPLDLFIWWSVGFFVVQVYWSAHSEFSASRLKRMGKAMKSI